MYRYLPNAGILIEHFDAITRSYNLQGWAKWSQKKLLFQEPGRSSLHMFPIFLLVFTSLYNTGIYQDVERNGMLVRYWNIQTEITSLGQRKKLKNLSTNQAALLK